MKSTNKLNWLRNFAALSLMLTMFAATSMVAFAAPGNVVRGELIVSGKALNGTAPAVSLNGEEALSGRTLNSASTIATTETTSANIRLRNLGTVSLAPNSTMTLSFDNNSITGTLTRGSVDVMNQSGVAVRITTANGVVGNNSLESGVVSANAKGLPKQDDDDDVSNGSQTALILIFAGIVAATAAYVFTRNNDDDLPATVSPVS